jgi:hypothetical protein
LPSAENSIALRALRSLRRTPTVRVEEVEFELGHEPQVM